MIEIEFENGDIAVVKNIEEAEEEIMKYFYTSFPNPNVIFPYKIRDKESGQSYSCRWDVHIKKIGLVSKDDSGDGIKVFYVNGNVENYDDLDEVKKGILDKFNSTIPFPLFPNDIQDVDRGIRYGAHWSVELVEK